MAMTVLVVEDHPATRTFITDALEVAGYRVLQAVGRAALALAQDQHPQVILLDLHMPELDGWEISRHLRADAQTAAIPIIAMSAGQRLASLPPDVADALLPKPFTLSALYAAVARWAPPAEEPPRAGPPRGVRGSAR